jgi:drug/metabolite transporter (DMT)-like permease
MVVSRELTGTAVVACAAMLLAATSVLAVVSYGGGANPSAVMLIRFIGAVAVLYTILRVSGAKIVLPPRARAVAFALGLVQAVQSYFLYNALDLIPVGLAMIIFYVYPLLVGLLASLVGQDRLTWTLGGGLVTAFVGLIFVFNVTGAEFSRLGAWYAVFTALCWSLVVVGNGWVSRGGDTRPVTLHIQISALVSVAVWLSVTGDVRLPATPEAWLGFALIPVFYGVGITLFFVAASMIGSVRTALIMNFEPVSAVVLGYLVLGQTLTPLQLVGGALVISALFVAHLRWRRPHPE